MCLLSTRALPAAIFLGLSLALGVSCKRPETAARERPVQRVELMQSIAGMTPAEEKALVDQLSVGFGVPAEPDEANPGAPLGPQRVFRLTLKGGPNPYTERGLGKTTLFSVGYGALFGAVLPGAVFAIWTTVRSAAIATGVGGLLGLGYGPIWYRDNQALLQRVGYLPWGFHAEWEVLDRRPRFGDAVVARSSVGGPFGRVTPVLDLKPFLQPLPAESRSADDVRRASLKAYGEALTRHFQKQH
jgi:hypothetical protein